MSLFWSVWPLLTGCIQNPTIMVNPTEDYTSSQFDE